MSGMVIIVVPTIRKDTLSGMIMVMRIMRGNDSSRDHGEEGGAGQEQERGKHGGNGASKEPWQKEG